MTVASLPFPKAIFGHADSLGKFRGGKAESKTGFPDLVWCHHGHIIRHRRDFLYIREFFYLPVCSRVMADDTPAAVGGGRRRRGLPGPSVRKPDAAGALVRDSARCYDALGTAGVATGWLARLNVQHPLTSAGRALPAEEDATVSTDSAEKLRDIASDARTLARLIQTALSIGSDYCFDGTFGLYLKRLQRLLTNANLQTVNSLADVQVLRQLRIKADAIMKAAEKSDYEPNNEDVSALTCAAELIDGFFREPAEQYVTLDQMAAIVGKSKKTLERELNKANSDMPGPDNEGGGGKAHEWRWSRIRPWLEKKYNRQLPTRFPQLSTS
jgi:hypothetical protein